MKLEEIDTFEDEENYLVTLRNDLGKELTVAIPKEGKLCSDVWDWGSTIYLNTVYGGHYY